MQVAAKNMPAGSTIIGVDLMNIKPIKGTIGIVADITTEKCRQLIRKELKTGTKAGVVMSDGAPNVGGGWTQDAFTQAGLVLMSLKCAVEWLAPGGTFVSKVFRSRDYNSLIYVLNKLFTKVHATKPVSSRTVSAEIFVVCTGYLAPDFVDPKMLDPKFVFSEVEEKPKVMDIFHPEKHHRHRDGYADDATSTGHQTFPVEAFIASNDFINILGTYNTLEFGPASEQFLNHKKTNDEIKELCKDLKVLGKKDFRILIKWRKDLSDWQHKEAKAAAAKAGIVEEESANETDSEAEEDRDQASLEDLADEVAEKQFREKKAERRKRDKSRVKARIRQALNMDAPEDVDQLTEDGQLFAMRQITSKAGLAAVDGADWENDEDEAGVYRPSNAPKEEDEDAGLDDDAAMERDLDQGYNDYLERKGMLTKKLTFRNKIKTLGVAKPKSEDAPEDDYVPEDLSEDDSDSDSEDEAEGGHKRKKHRGPNPLVVGQRNSVAVKDKVTSQWFAQSQFAGMADSDSEEDFDFGDDTDGKKTDGADVAAADQALEDEADAGGKKASKAGFNLDSDTDSDGEQDPGFEVVTAAAHAPKPIDTSKNLDAHGLALAAEMILRKKKREILDNAYNRYTFNDPEMPNWFADEEEPHMTAGMIMTKEMAKDIKDRQREINARPIKKVLEAKGRDERRTQMERSKTAKRATAINDNPVLSEGEKTQQIRELFGKARRKGEAAKDDKPTFVVAKKSQKGKVGRPNGVEGRFKIVDKRFRSDLRGKRNLDRRKERGNFNNPGKNGRYSKKRKSNS
jgi:AdoMet-dependent rRNA methyltransferase SPB1